MTGVQTCALPICTNTSAEFAVTSKTGVDITGLSGWAYEVDPVDRTFIEAILAGEAIPSTKIENLTVAKLTGGVINATETITSEGVIRAVDNINTPTVQTGIGPIPLTVNGVTVTALMWAFNAAGVTFAIDELGNATFGGELVAATGVLGNPSGNRVEYDGSNLIINTDNLSLNADGNASFSGEITGSTITGGQLRTSATGKRVVIDGTDNSLVIYDSSNDVIASTNASVTVGGGSFTPTYFLTSDGGTSISLYTEATGSARGIVVESESGQGIRSISTGSTGIVGSGLNTGILGTSVTGNGIEGVSEDDGIGVFGTSENLYGALGFSKNSHGVVGNSNSAAMYDFYAIGAGGNYGPFTGAHDGLLSKDLDPRQGDILGSNGQFERANVSSTIPYLEQPQANSKAVYGVFVGSGKMLNKDRPSALKTMTHDDYEALSQTHNRAVVNALGEGQVNVCSENGNFEVGDFICTSNTAGKGMRYDGQDMRYVVAKCMEPVVWTDEPDNIKMVACIYMCG